VNPDRDPPSEPSTEPSSDRTLIYKTSDLHDFLTNYVVLTPDGTMSRDGAHVEGTLTTASGASQSFHFTLDAEHAMVMSSWGMRDLSPVEMIGERIHWLVKGTDGVYRGLVSAPPFMQPPYVVEHQVPERDGPSMHYPPSSTSQPYPHSYHDLRSIQHHPPRANAQSFSAPFANLWGGAFRR